MSKHSRFFDKLEKRPKTRRCKGCRRRFVPMGRHVDKCPECLKPAERSR